MAEQSPALLEAEEAASTDGRYAIRSVADEVRELTATLVGFDADDHSLAEAAKTLRTLTGTLRGTPRQPGAATRFDLEETAGRAFSVAHGIGNALAPPLNYSWTGDEVVAECVLGPQYEGPQSHAHGGMSALLLDDVLARIPLLCGRPRVTRSLEIVYRKPLPLGEPLVIRAREAAAEPGQRDSAVRVHGTIATAEAPNRVLVESSGVFVLLREDQIRRVNPHWTPGDRWHD